MSVPIDDDKALFGIISSFELAGDLATNVVAMNLLIPLGEIVPILTGLPGVPTPDPNIFQVCDGGEITNPNSPLRTIGGVQRFVPDMRDRFIKVPSVFGQSGETGGVKEFNLAHDHGGRTGDFTSGIDVDQSSAVPAASAVHDHEIEEALSASFNIEPPFTTVRYFMRIQ